MAATASASIEVEAQSALATSPRTLLVSMLIKHHPEQVFEGDSARQLRLQAASLELLSAIQSLAACSQESPHCSTKQTVENLTHARHSFVHHFLTWKREDGRRLAATVLLSYSELLQMKQSVQHSDDWQQGVDRQLLQLEQQLKQLLGPQCTKQHIDELKQQASEVSCHPASEHLPSEPASAGRPIRQGFLLGKGKDKSSKASRAARKREPSRSPATTPPASPAVAPADPYRNLELASRLMSPASLPTAAEPSISSSPVEMQVQQMMRRAMDDKFKDEIEANDHSMLRANLMQLRESLINLVPNRPDIATELRDGMPVESITAYQGDPVDTTRLVLLLDCSVSWILQFEAPKHNSETREWHQSTMQQLADSSIQASTVVPAIIWWMLNRVHKIHLEVATAHAQAVLRTHGAEYQRELTAQAISEGKMDVSAIEQWVSVQMKTLNDAAVDPTATTLAAAGISALICNSTVDVPQHLKLHLDQLLDWRARFASMVQQQVCNPHRSRLHLSVVFKVGGMVQYSLTLY